MTYDLVVRNGTVVDGSGRPRHRADVAVSDGRIAALGTIPEAGTAEVDAEGHFVAPGFIEIHSHMDAQVFWDPLGTCSSWHGVTTSVLGNCGFTLAPCREEDADLVFRNLERAEDIPREALLAGVPWQWESYAEYLDAIDRSPKGINYAGYIGHSALRTHVMGERAFEGPANEDDLTAMRREVEDALEAGAIGLSTSRSPNHATSDDRPVASRMASWHEVQLLVDVLRASGVGIFEIANEQPTDPAARHEYQGRLRRLAVDSGRPVTFIIGYGPEAPDRTGELLRLLDSTASAGGRMVGQGHSREFISVVGFPVHLPFDSLPAWREVRARSLPDQRRALNEERTRAALVDQALNGPYRDPIGAEARPPQFDLLRVLDSGEGPWRTVAELAAERGTTPVDVIIDLSLAADFDLFFGQPFANQDMGVVFEIIDHPRVVVGASDSGAHVSQIIDCSIPTHLLAHWVRREQALTWEQAVRMLTLDPALEWGFHDRGLVRVGSAADLCIFDPATVGPGLPTAAKDLPAGATRLKQAATGILATVVNGEVLFRNGEHTGALPGRLLRGPLAGRR
jgi:N-acyl-D-aspartate/D-glutamate deacylase